MLTPRSAVAVCMICFLTLVPQTFGWSHKEHVLFTRMAISRLLDDPATPAAMRHWLREAAGELPDLKGYEAFFLNQKVGIEPLDDGFTNISHWVYMPDVHSLTDPATKKVAPYNAHEKLLHYIDLELFITGDAPRVYKHNLSNKPKLSDIPRTTTDARYIQAGYLPFRIEQCYDELVKAIRAKRMHAATHEQQENRTATFWAGYLAHHLADNTQPQHATLDYKSASYFSVKTRAPNVHAELEYRMCDDEEKEFPGLRREFWPMYVRQLSEFQDPVTNPDVWKASLEVSLLSYDALPLIGLAAMHAGKQAGTPEKPTGPFEQTVDTEAFFRFKGQYLGREMSVMEMKAIHNAWAVKRIEKTLRQAWDEAMKPARNDQ